MEFRKLAASIVVMAMIACGAHAEDVLRFATWSTGESLEIQREIAKDFEVANPGVSVQVEAYADGYDQKLIASFGAGDPPDVMYMWNFPKYAPSLAPLNAQLNSSAVEMDLDDIPPALFNISTIEGNIYGVPIGFTTHAIFYNKDLFASAGIDEPQAGWTWDDLRAAAALLRDAENNVYGYAVEATPDVYDYEQFFWSNGTKLIADDGSAVEGYMNSPEAVEVLTMFADMATAEEAIVLGVGGTLSGSDLFKAGKLAMFETALWSKDGIDEAGVNYGTVMLPRFGDKPVQSTVNASAMSMAAETKNPDIAWEFIKFYATPEAVRKRTNEIPIRTSVANELKLTEDPVYKPFFDILAVSGTEANAFLKHENWGKIQTNLERAIEATMIDRGNAQKHLDDAVERSARHLN